MKLNGLYGGLARPFSPLTIYARIPRYLTLTLFLIVAMLGTGAAHAERVENFETGVMPAGWSSSGFSVNGSGPHEGAFSIASTNYTPVSRSFTFTATTAAGQVSFWYKNGHLLDYLTLHVDGVMKASFNGSYENQWRSSATMDYTTVSAGTHTFTFTFIVGGPPIDGIPWGMWVDEIVIPVASAADDRDGDGVVDASDNCPTVVNADQLDTDGDGQGNLCDNDDDNDGSSDNREVNVYHSDPLVVDSDGDGLIDGSDNCPNTPIPDQLNTDGDLWGDVCDTDDDNDGLSDTQEAGYGTDPLKVDSDGDGLSDFAELKSVGSDPLVADTDADGLIDGSDNCPTVSNAAQADTNGDGLGDHCSAVEDFNGGAFTLAGWKVMKAPDWRVINGKAEANYTYANPSYSVAMTYAGETATGLISFDYQTSIISDYNVLYFYIDGVKKQQWQGSNNLLEKVSYLVPAGYHTFTWELASSSFDSSKAWVDNVVLPVSSVKDSDGDGVVDIHDNCVNVANAVQSDGDGDGVGDLCRATVDFENGGLNPLPWVTGGNAAWTVTTTRPHGGSYAAEAPVSLVDNQRASLSITTETLDGEMSFWPSTSTDVYDYMQFYIDGVARGRWNGERGYYLKESNPVTAGTHTFTWEYVKDGSGSGGLDSGWIDDLKLPVDTVKDSDADGVADWKDNCPSTVSNASQLDSNGDGVGDACSLGVNFESGALDQADWVGSGDAAWAVGSTSVHGGGYAAEVPAGLGDNQSSVLAYSAVTVSGTVSFWLNVSSESGADMLHFAIDGVDKGTWSGESGWQRVQYPVSAGTHTFSWRYAKNGSGAAGQDRAWLDDIVFAVDKAADRDGDGLKDFDEWGSYGTDPARADSDGDGLSDGEEQQTYGTSPTNGDSDGDGLNDGEELQVYGTDPLNSDSDGDGHVDGSDAFPLDATESADSDGDGVGDNSDLFPDDATEVTDVDGDGVGDNADRDDDNDGIPDTYETLRGLDPHDPTDAGLDLDADGYSNLIEYRFGSALDDINSVPEFSLLDTDSDGDGIPDSADAFPQDANEYIDSDGDGIGDNADSDDDGDGIVDQLDGMPLNAQETLDSDGDGVGDNSDAFISDPTESLDTDGDGIGNNADGDDDNDGIDDSVDAFPLDATESVDSDGDGVGDNADAFPNDAAEWLDTDGDGTGNNADTDDDGDGVADATDNCPLVANATQSDGDRDGVGDACDTPLRRSSGGGGAFGPLVLLLLGLAGGLAWRRRV